VSPLLSRATPSPRPNDRGPPEQAPDPAGGAPGASLRQRREPAPLPARRAPTGRTRPGPGLSL